MFTVLGGHFDDVEDKTLPYPHFKTSWRKNNRSGRRIQFSAKNKSSVAAKPEDSSKNEYPAS